MSCQGFSTRYSLHAHILLPLCWQALLRCLPPPHIQRADRRGFPRQQVMQPFCMQPFALRGLACRLAAHAFAEALRLSQMLYVEEA